MRVPADYNGLDPAWNQAGNVFADNSFSEHSATKDVPDCPVGRAPHLLKFELLHTLLVRRYGGALDANVVASHSLCSIYCHLVVSDIAVLHSQIIAAIHRGIQKRPLRVLHLVQHVLDILMKIGPIVICGGRGDSPFHLKYPEKHYIL